MECNFSIVICCYNSSKRLPKTLESISLLNRNDNFKFEVIVVDNSSTDSTFETAKKLCEKFTNNIDFKVVTESSKGLSHARKKGILESKYEYVLFCDDDNWLNNNYLIHSFEILSNNFQISMLGGIGTEIVEDKPKDWFATLKYYYGIGEQYATEGDISTKKGYVYGAGAIVKKSVLLKLYAIGFKHILSDRTGDSNKIIGGGDNEIGYAIVLLGGKVFYSSKLTFKHFIPKERLVENYIFRLLTGQIYTYTAVKTYENYIFRNDLEYKNLNFKKKVYKNCVLILKLCLKLLFRKIDLFNFKLKYNIAFNNIKYYFFYQSIDFETYRDVKENIKLLEINKE